jgi:hypothetical protein
MPVKAGQQHPVAGMEKFRLQFAPLFAEGLLRTASSCNVCEKIPYLNT